ncbi:MAG: hypothetical protein AB2746_17060, partial [Candidatus Thiodiazotropha taylori]
SAGSLYRFLSGCRQAPLFFFLLHKSEKCLEIITRPTGKLEQCGTVFTNPMFLDFYMAFSVGFFSLDS